MRNGDIGNFLYVRRPLLNSLSDAAFHAIYGTTAMYVRCRGGRRRPAPTASAWRQAGTSRIISTTSVPFRRFTPEQLLWPLNAVEQKHAPAELFVAGDPDLLRAAPCVAIVGSRAATPAGRARATRLASLLAERHVIVVSGLASGIDTAAHTASMAAGGRTIAVVGTPLDQCVPSENRELQQRIADQHLVVSQFATGTAVKRRAFPQRNRTIALLCDAAVIIEATDRSGTLNLGWEALRLGRPLWIAAAVFADEALAFPSQLARYGANELSDTTLASFLAQLPSGRRDSRTDRPL